MSITEELLNYIEALRYEHLPDPVIEMVKKSVINNFSAAMAGSSTDVCTDLVNLVKEWGGKPEGTILIYGGKVPVPNAAWVNSAMVRGLDFDDVHDGMGHANATVVPAALAIAEYSQAFRNKAINGKDLIVAIELGDELTIRLSKAGGQGTGPRGWLAEPFACLGVAALGAKMLGLDKEKMRNALGIAYFQCFGNIGAASGEGAGKMPSVGQGLATRAGVLSVILADRGFTAARDIFDGKYGLYSLYGNGEYHPEILLGGLGERYESLKLRIKAYAGCSLTQNTIYGAIELAKENNIRAEDVARVNLRVCQESYEVCVKGKSVPSSAVNALWNYPYSTAVALVKGNVFVDDFTEEAIKNPQVLELLKKVSIEVNPNMTDFLSTGADVEIITKDGKSYSMTVEHPKGHFLNPMSLDELAVKFKRCNQFSARPVSDERAEDLIQTVNELDELDDVTEIMSMLS